VKFQKGKSGNPSGRPKVVTEVRDLARAHTATALKSLVAIYEDDAQDPRARVAAAKEVLDRGFGKPVQSIDMKSESHAHVEFDQLDDSTLIERAKAMFGGGGEPPARAAVPLQAAGGAEVVPGEQE
jgi:hypothetical protein